MDIPPRPGTPFAAMNAANTRENCSDMELLCSNSELEDESIRLPKRPRSEEEEGWNTVEANKKRRGNRFWDRNNFEVYISYKEPLPKQFTLAKIMRDYSIKNINQIKYLSPFKIRLQFVNKEDMNKLVQCEPLLAQGWRFQKAMELSVCYGIIKNVELDTPDEEILSTITCPPPAKLLSFTRLNQRSVQEGGWRPSETLRLSFEGDCLPEYVSIYDTKVKVLPYVHRVSQCSQCWKLGHTRKMCPRKETLCPKCGGQHENCTIEIFCCVNCGGDHISMSKTCPVYKKERKLREIMADYTCTYRRALELYSPRKITVTNQPSLLLNNPQSFPPLRGEETPVPVPPPSSEPSYAEVSQKRTAFRDRRKKKIEKSKDKEDWLSWLQDNVCDDTRTPNETKDKSEKRPPLHFRDLLSRIKEVIFLQQLSISSKLASVTRLCIEWFVAVLRNFISEMPWMESLLNLFTNSQ